jgi:putative hydrolase of the HAD superfamily
VSAPNGIKAFLFDVDGVLRLWDGGQVPAIELAYGLEPGTLTAIAYDPDRFGPALLGRMSDQDWRASVAAALVPLCGDVSKAIDCVVDWSARHGQIDPEVLDVITGLRAEGAGIGLIANATDRLRFDLVELEVAEKVDAIIDSAHEGVAKPDAGIFLRAAEILEVSPERCLYVGARPEHVAGAERTGMKGHLYDGVVGLRAMLERLPTG